MTKILVVEDSPTQAEQLRLILESEGFQVEMANSGEAALLRIDRLPIDLVISDIMMPGLSGYELCSRIKNDARHRDVPVILLSSLNDPMDIIRGLECEADNFVTKPYEAGQLLARIHTVLQNKRARDGGKLTFGVEIVFLGKKFVINSEKEQILDLLIATFEDIVRTNRGLQESKAELAVAKEEIESYARELERRVQERTAALSQQRRELARAQEIAHLGNWRLTVATNNIEWSEELYRIYGMQPGATAHSLAASLLPVHPADRAALAAAISRSITQGVSFREEYRILRTDGEERYCWAEGHCQFSGDGRVEALFGICQDVTERTRAELAARESTERYRHLVEFSPDGILVHVDGAIVLANQAAARIFGAKLTDDLIGRPILDLVHPDNVADFSNRWNRPQEGGASALANEEKMLRLGGSTLDAEISSSLFMHQNRPAVQEIVRDVTERKMMQQQLYQAQKMEVVGQLTGGLAHDFNNLLTIMIGNLDLLEAEFNMPAAAAVFSKAALDAALRGADLTRQLLAFSRRQQLHSKVFNLNELVTGITALLARTLGESIRIEALLAEDLWSAEADPSQVESALVNLAVNARDAMPNGGRLTVETGNKYLDGAYASENAEVTPGDYVMLAVTDTGSGITPEVLPRVFDPFFTTKAEGKGTGLGLSMIYGFVKQSGGHIKIYSEIDHGTTVRLYLPKAGSQFAGDTEVAYDEGQLQGHGEIVLVVEDNPDVRAVVVGQLVRTGYRVLQAENGSAAFEILERGDKIDLLFTDVVMPGGLSGLELGRKARALRPHLAILYTSGFTENSIQKSMSADPHSHLLSKPYRRQDLARKIREVLLRG